MTIFTHKFRLKDVTEIQVGFPFKSAEYSDTGIKLLRGDNIGQGFLQWNGVKFWPIEKSSHLSQYILQKDDVVIAMDRPWISSGLKYSVIHHENDSTLLVQRVARLRSLPNIHKYILPYIIGSRNFTNYVLSVQTGTTIPHISLDQIGDYEFFAPPIKEQEKIGSLLRRLDDKIDLNRRTNETLEAMARALFRDWFVDFGPTRAKMAGKAPYLAPELWELFPDRLDDEGKPEGWQSLSLADLAILSKSSINPAQFSDEYFLHFSLPAFDKGMMPDLVKGEEIKSGKFSLPNNSILLSKLNPETPRVWMVTAHEEPYQRICSTEFIVLNPLQKDWLALIYCACLSQPFRETLQGMVTGTSKSHQRVQPLAVMQTHLLHATDIIMRQFGLTAQPLFAKINFNRNESNTLAQFRDLLLPKLMSGEISIRDAEKMVEDAA